jgi:hypothetical protein
MPVIQHLGFAAGLLVKCSLLLIVSPAEVLARHAAGRIREFLTMLLPQSFTVGFL